MKSYYDEVTEFYSWTCTQFQKGDTMWNVYVKTVVCVNFIFLCLCMETLYQLYNDKAPFNVLLCCLDLPPTLKNMAIYNLLELTLVYTIDFLCVGGK